MLVPFALTTGLLNDPHETAPRRYARRPGGFGRASPVRTCNAHKSGHGRGLATFDMAKFRRDYGPTISFFALQFRDDSDRIKRGQRNNICGNRLACRLRIRATTLILT